MISALFRLINEIHIKIPVSFDTLSNADLVITRHILGSRRPVLMVVWSMLMFVGPSANGRMVHANGRRAQC